MLAFEAEEWEREIKSERARVRTAAAGVAFPSEPVQLKAGASLPQLSSLSTSGRFAGGKHCGHAGMDRGRVLDDIGRQAGACRELGPALDRGHNVRVNRLKFVVEDPDIGRNRCERAQAGREAAGIREKSLVLATLLGVSLLRHDLFPVADNDLEWRTGDGTTDLPAKAWSRPPGVMPLRAPETVQSVTLGLSTITVDRLAKRGLLRPCRATRRTLLSHLEVERFLRDTYVTPAQRCALPEPHPGVGEESHEVRAVL